MLTTTLQPAVHISRAAAVVPEDAVPKANPRAQGLAELQRLAGTARVFMSMPYVQGRFSTGADG